MLREFNVKGHYYNDILIHREAPINLISNNNSATRIHILLMQPACHESNANYIRLGWWVNLLVFIGEWERAHFMCSTGEIFVCLEHTYANPKSTCITMRYAQT